MSIEIYNNIAIKTLLVGLIVLGSHISNAQNNIQAKKTPSANSLTKIRLTFLGAGIEREQKISKLSTIYAGVSMDAVFPFEPDAKPNRSDMIRISRFVGFTPVTYAGFRRYYNLLQRVGKNKETIHNSANYYGLQVEAQAPIDSDNGGYTTLWTMMFSPQWGLQRNLSKRANFEFNIGPAIKTNFESFYLFPTGKLGISILL